MKHNVSTPRSANIKIALIIIAFAIVTGILLYTQSLIKQLQEKEREVADLYARSWEYLALGEVEEGDFSFIFDEIIKTIYFPVILTDNEREPIYPYHHNIKNVRLDTTLSREKQREYLLRLMSKMEDRNPPLKLTYQDTIVLSYLFYGESDLIRQLRWFPYVEIALAALFILIGYIGFSYIKRSEQSNIWVGMSRETAHQIGTPLSSMMGWVELLREQSERNNEASETIQELQKDLDRLNKIAARFSKIGSRPELHDMSIVDVVQAVVQYFERRLPQMQKHVKISVHVEKDVIVPINAELFEWVIENLIKNALDAIENSDGKIDLYIDRKKNHVYIDVVDTGKGIDKKIRKDIFRPGFSTKKRGWGLGLSLSKRIIENYHHGKLTIKDSKVGEGTTFRIRLTAS